MQLDLFALLPPKAQIHSLFLALFPDRSTLDQLSKVTGLLRRKHDLRGKPRTLEHLHLTMQWLGQFDEVPESLVGRVAEACQKVTSRWSPFEVSLEQVRSFSGRPGHHPLVLCGSEPADLAAPDSQRANAALSAFHQDLMMELVKASVRCPKGVKFSPHVTLMYDRMSLATEVVEQVTWTVNEVALIHSEVGKTRYHRLGQWCF